MDIQWYPGHMAKTKKLLLQQLSKANFVIEICDARMPKSSRNPDLDVLIGAKKRILLLNKIDLAENEETERWIDYFKKANLKVIAFNSQRGKISTIHKAIKELTQDLTNKSLQRGYKRTIRAIVVGVPNVGKSTFINRLYGRNLQEIGDKPGVTRANQWVKINPYLEIMDTPGLLWPRLDDKIAARRLAYIGTIKDSVLDTQTLAESLLQEIFEKKSDILVNRYKINKENLNKNNLLEAACRGRGWILRGGIADTERASIIILDEFREGILGKISLEKAPTLDSLPVLRLRRDS